jgi:hypothetical protein
VIVQTNDARKTSYLLQATLSRIENNLVAEAIAAIRPKIVEQVKLVLKELEPSLAQYHKLEEDQLIFQLAIKEPK